MILTDVFFPALNKHFDFQIAVDISIDLLMAEMVEVICQSERVQPGAAASHMLLCDLDGKRILDPNLTLESYGIRNAARLLLV